jgi:hypothetical protein
MGPGVTLEKVKATRVQLDRIMEVQATNRTLTKKFDDRDDWAKLGMHNTFVFKPLLTLSMPRRRITRCRGRLPQPAAVPPSIRRQGRGPGAK